MKSLGALRPEQQTQIRLELIPFESLQLLRDVLESWRHIRPRSKLGELDEDLLQTLRADPHLGFLYPLLETNRNPVPYRSLLRIVMRRFGGNLAVLESPYLEMEFWDTYAYFHSRSFLSRRKQCWRLHFFRHDQAGGRAAQELPTLLYEGAPQTAIEKAGFLYLGFATVRPTKSYNLGRTAILFDPAPGRLAHVAEDSQEASSRSYCKGQSPQIANVCAAQLSVDTVSFLQQDPVVGMCATASLWVASQVLAAKFDLHKYPYIDISRQATQTDLAPFVAQPPDGNEHFAHGLSVPEVCSALHRTGAVPLVISTRHFGSPDRSSIQAAAHIQDQLYTFVESELPVIVHLARRGRRMGHAVTAVGHLQPNISSIDELGGRTIATACPIGSSSQYLVSLTVTRFYVHNDSYGPFDRLDFLSRQDLLDAGLEGKECDEYACPVRLSRTEGKDDILDIRSLVIPVPPYVKNRPGFVLQDASIRFAKLFHEPAFDEDGFKVLWRMLLVKGSRFKQSLVERKWPRPLIEAYARVHLPKYVWLCEITLFSEDDIPAVLAAGRPRPVHGEFIFDTTTPPYTTHAVVQRLGPYFITDDKACTLPDDQRDRVLQEALLPGIPPDDERDCFTGGAQG